MPQDVEDQDLQSSEQVEDVTEASPAQADDAGAADPSPAPEKDEPKDMLSVVRDVIGKTEEPAPSATEPAEETVAAGDAEPEPKETDDTNYSDVPFNKHPRFQQLLRQKKEFEADAQQHRIVQDFMKQNDLDPEEAADGLQIMALMKKDPTKALEALKPHIQRLLEATGETLPQDLRAKVQAGELPLDAAKEVSRARATLQHQQETQRQAEQRRQEDERVQQGRALRDTAISWANDRNTRDPAFQSKEPLMRREIAFLQREEGIPNTPEGVRDQLNRAYASVNQQARVVAPAAAPRPAVRPVTGGTAPGTPAAEPASMLDAIKMGLRK
ncbi:MULTISPECIES: hypothetical protein [Paracoccus]|mgnify:CR=1 FL=1|uniref:hypothetical protein n=1 Tax=Paracoccus TaxID=265 RepID=UPI0023F474FF|nr:MULTISPECIES: hypothetical protein [Paracoccus]